MSVSIFIVTLPCHLLQPWLLYDGMYSVLVSILSTQPNIDIPNVVSVSKMNLHHHSECPHRGLPNPWISPVGCPIANGRVEESDCDGDLRVSSSASETVARYPSW